MCGTMATNSTSSASNAQYRKRLYCPHCDEHVSRSLYYQHKQLYFDSTQHQWKRYRTSTSTCTPSDVNFEFSPDKDHCTSGLTADSLETEGIMKYGFSIGDETLELVINVDPYCVLDFNLSCDESSDDDVSNPGPTDINNDLEVSTHLMCYTGLIVLCYSYDIV